jgi:hypothetical protein
MVTFQSEVRVAKLPCGRNFGNACGCVITRTFRTWQTYGNADGRGVGANTSKVCRRKSACGCGITRTLQVIVRVGAEAIVSRTSAPSAPPYRGRRWCGGNQGADTAYFLQKARELVGRVQ